MRRPSRAGQKTEPSSSVADALRVIEHDHARGFGRTQRLGAVLDEALDELSFYDRETAERLKAKVWETAFTNEIAETPDDGA